MKTVIFMLLSFIGGYFGGAVFAKLISVVVLQLFDPPAWLQSLRYMPIACGLGAAALALLWPYRRKKDGR